MEYSIWEQVANIPWTVYAFALFILYSIYRTTKPAIIPVRVLMFVPAFFALITSFYYLTTKNSLISLMICFLPGVAAGILISRLKFKSQQVKAIRGEKKLYLSGSWSTVTLLAVIIIVQGLLSWVVATHPAWQHKQVFNFSWFFIYGFFAGLFVGRMGYAFRCLKHGPFITMEEAKAKI